MFPLQQLHQQEEFVAKRMNLMAFRLSRERQAD